MKRFNVYISETYSGYIDIQAESEEEAEDLARQQLADKKIDARADFEGDYYIEATEAKNE